jgi:YYY domain-containing protein
VRDILSWAAAVELLGVAALPLLRAFFNNRRDAALLSRPVGLALVAYVAWAATLAGLPFERGVLMIAFLVVALVSYLIHRKTPRAEPAERFWGPEENRAALLFWGSTAVFLVIRAAVPEILGQEKFMDLAFLTSLSRHAVMPPLDPWMSGKTINYYYWGYLLAAALTKFAHIPTLVSYNMALATFAGYSFVAAASLGMRLADGRLAAGIAAGFGTVFAGNLAGALDGWKYLFFSLPKGNWQDFNYFAASRVIGAGDTINEFPFFTFFQADLHPHLLGFPYFIAAFVMGHRFLVRELSPPAEPTPGAWAFVKRWSVKLAPAALFALVAGTAIHSNLWAIPAIGILIVVACVLRPTRGASLPKAEAAAIWAVGGGILLLVAYVLFWSYERSFHLTPANPQERGLARTTMTSGLIEFVAVWGILFAVMLAALWPASPEDESARRRESLTLAVVAGLAMLVALAVRAPALIILLFLGFLAARIAWNGLRSTHDASEIYASFLLLLGLSMVAGCEFVHFRDSYGDKMQRMNTIFKFYHQAWPLLAIGTAVFAERRWRTAACRRVLRWVGAAAVFLAVLYPAAATIQRVGMRDGPFTLDAGPALARRDRDDALAIEWLTKNARLASPGGPPHAVVLEASGDPYSEFARISTHTGVPTVMGWANHEGLWRSNDAQIATRVAYVRAFYSAPNPALAARFIEDYHIKYIVLGNLERRTYPSASAFTSLPFINLVFPGGTAVYQVFGVP